MVKLIDGTALAVRIREDLRREILKGKLRPSLAIILVGDDPGSVLYVKLKKKAASELGIEFHEYIAPKDAGESYILKIIDRLNNDPLVHAIVLQLPLPQHLFEDRLISSIDPAKDADGFHYKNLELLAAGTSYIIPALTQAICALILETHETISGKKAVIIANSKTFAQPLEKALEWEGVSTRYVLSGGSSVKEELQHADIVVVAVGEKNFIGDTDCKKGAIVIDVGINRENGKTLGDVDPGVYTNGKRIAWVSPVPGGVGPVTVAMLLKNVVELTRKQKSAV